MQTLEIIGAIIGLIYLYLEYKANKWLWLFGVIMPVVYNFIFNQSKFYADMGINAYYFFRHNLFLLCYTFNDVYKHII